jgi:hypothetical protein
MQTFLGVLNIGLQEGLDGVALVDRNGTVVDLAGDLDVDEAMPMAALVMSRAKDDDATVSARLFRGEILVDQIERGDVAVAVAGRQLFVVARLGSADTSAVERVRVAVEQGLARDLPPFTPPRGGSGGSGPDDLALIELGITVPRTKA